MPKKRKRKNPNHVQTRIFAESETLVGKGRGYLAKNGVPDSERGDMVQIARTRFAQNADSQKLPLEQQSYFFRILHNLIVDRIRRRSVGDRSKVRSVGEWEKVEGHVSRHSRSPETELAVREWFGMLEKRIKKRPDDPRRTKTLLDVMVFFRLQVLDGYSVQEIADGLEISNPTIARKLVAFRKFVKDEKLHEDLQ